MECQDVYPLKDDTFSRVLDEDKSTRHWLKQLMKNLG
uniref:Uncharacterized protein n=1 Tax=Parascaris equorum TaxID=6256 RepID=A0A914S3D2_PAREQ